MGKQGRNEKSKTFFRARTTRSLCTPHDDSYLPRAREGRKSGAAARIHPSSMMDGADGEIWHSRRGIASALCHRDDTSPIGAFGDFHLFASVQCPFSPQYRTTRSFLLFFGDRPWPPPSSARSPTAPRWARRVLSSEVVHLPLRSFERPLPRPWRRSRQHAPAPAPAPAPPKLPPMPSPLGT